MSESDTPSTPEPEASPPAGEIPPFASGASSQAPGMPAIPELYPLGRPPKSPFAAETPRLGIIHFLVAMTGVAISMSGMRWIDDMRRASTPEAARLEYAEVFQTLQGIPAGLALASLGFVPARWRRGQRYPVWPGEWLLLHYGLSAVLGLSASIVLETSQATGWLSNDPMDMSRRIGLLYVALMLGQCVIPAIAAVRVRIRPWRLYFTITALLCLLMAGVYGVSFGWGSFQCVGLADVPCIVLLLAAMIGDLARRRQLPWTHWLGAALYTWALAMSVAWVVALMFLFN